MLEIYPESRRETFLESLLRRGLEGSTKGLELFLLLVCSSRLR